MSIEYVSQDEIEAHEAAMQRVVVDEKKEREEIDKTKKRDIMSADDMTKKKIKASEAKMRKAIEVAKRANDEAIEAAKKDADDQIKAAEAVAEQKQKQLVHAEKKLAMQTCMQRDFDRLPLLRQVYHEAPNDVFELIVSKCSDVDGRGRGRGGLNAFTLANKRLKQVVESCTTRLTNRQQMDGPDSLPAPIIQSCRRIEGIRCDSRNLRSLEGCPDGLKKLSTSSPHVSDLSPLASCSMMGSLEIRNSSMVTDISAVSSMPLLESFVCPKGQGRPSIKDLSPLSSCLMLKKLDLYGNRELKDLSPLSACIALETLYISNCPLITSLAPLSACTALQTLVISGCSLITSLAPLSTLVNLKTLHCNGIHPQTSLLPLASFAGLKTVWCSANAVDLHELRKKRPELIIEWRTP